MFGANSVQVNKIRMIPWNNDFSRRARRCLGREWEMTSLGRLLPSLHGIKLAFVILPAAELEGLRHDSSVQHYCS